MPRESRQSIKRSENGATYYVRSRTLEHLSCFADSEIKEWVYRHILWMGSIYYVTFRAISVTDDRYQIVLSVNKPKANEQAVAKRFKKIQGTNRIPLKWYSWRMKEWYDKLTDLSEFMKRLNQSIARHIQSELGHKGTVWRDRFKAQYLETDAEILSNMAFLELTCVRTGLSEVPGKYDWCSAGRILSGGKAAAGVSMPTRAAFRFLGKGDQRYRTYCLFANRLEKGGHAIKKAVALKSMFDEVEPKTFLKASVKPRRGLRQLPPRRVAAV